MKIFWGIFLSFFLVIPFARAQTVSLEQTNENLTFDLSPRYPRPFELVKISTYSPSVNLDTVRIEWAVDGTVMLDGTGQKSFSFVAKDLGSETKVRMTVYPPYGTSFYKEVVIAPSTLDILWEAHTYTPPFYKGKALFSKGSEVSITAMPTIWQGGREMLPQNLIYQWSRELTALPDRSGFGKQTLTLEGSMWGGGEKINLAISSSEGKILIEKKFEIKLANTKVIAYEQNPLLGTLFNRAVQGAYALGSENEAAIVGIPLFFSANSQDFSNLSFTWKMNGKAISNKDNGNTIIFRDESETSGQTLIDLSVNQKDNSAQYGSTRFSLLFD